jgi:hypothetical protein
VIRLESESGAGSYGDRAAWRAVRGLLGRRTGAYWELKGAGIGDVRKEVPYATLADVVDSGRGGGLDRNLVPELVVVAVS